MTKRKDRRSNLEKNIDALREFELFDLADSIEEAPDKEDWFEHIRARNGSSNLLVKIGNRKISAYDMENPLKEARATSKGAILYKQKVSVVLGLGCGHLTKNLLVRKETAHRVVVVEPHYSIIKLAFTIYDFSKYLKDGTLILAPDGDSVRYVFWMLDEALVVEDWTLLSENYSLMVPSYKEIYEVTITTSNSMMCNIGTVAGSGSKIADNDIANLPYVIRHRGVNELIDMFKNKPAIIVSTGPSLSKNIHLLRDMKDKVVIIAVAQALRPLLAYDIRPDFICTVDFGDVNIGHFKGLMDYDVPLIALNRTYAPLLKEWRGTKFIAATPAQEYHQKTVGSILDGKGVLEHGGSVAHFALGAAYKMGCNPITLIGQDLSYEGKQSHVSGADAGGTVRIEDGILFWDVQDPRSHLADKKHKQGHTMGPVSLVPGYFGGLVTTNMGLASFVTSFEAMVKGKVYPDGTEVEVMNCTEGGANIKGAERMSLASWLDLYAIETIDKSAILPLTNSLADDAGKLIAKALPALDQDIKDLKEMIHACKMGLKSNKRMLKDGITKQELLDEFATNEHWSKQAQDKAKASHLIGVAIYGASRQIYSHRLSAKSSTKHLVKDDDDRAIRIERNELILNAAEKAGEQLLESYQETRNLLDTYQTTKDESLLLIREPEEHTLNDVLAYFEAGNWAHPLLEAGKILQQTDLTDEYWDFAQNIYIKAEQMRDDAIKQGEEEYSAQDTDKRIKYNKLIDQSQTAGREDKDYDKALELLTEAAELFPDKVEAKWGLATTLHHMGKNEQAIVEYDWLIEDRPDDLQFQYERGMVMLHINFQDGMKLIGEVMNKTDAFNAGFAWIGTLYDKNEMYEEAIIAYEEYLKHYPGDHAMWKRLGAVLQKTGKGPQATKAFRKAKKISGR